MIHLIVNADDYGLSPAVSRGIRHAHQHGIVTSTTVMMTVPTAADDVRTAMSETPNLGLGLHITLVGMGLPPLLPRQRVPSLVRPDGLFYDEPAWSARFESFSADEVNAEIDAQFDAFLRAAGRLPTHLDSHYHAAYRQPAALEAMHRLARAHNLPVRSPGVPGAALDGLRTPSAFLAVHHDSTALTVTQAITLLTAAHAGTDTVAELMCHPGYVDAALAQADSMTDRRIHEIAILCDPAVRAACAAPAVRLVNFAAL